MYSPIALFLTEAAHYRCLLLVHVEMCVLQKAASELEAKYGWPRLSIGKQLSAVLLSEPPSHRPRAAQRWMEDCLGQMTPGPVLCTEIDLLFDPTLKLDPLVLLRSTSKITKIVVTWPGNYVGGVLVYAVPGHAHYRTFRQPDVLVLALDQTPGGSVHALS